MRILSPAFHTAYQYNLAASLPEHEWTFFLGVWSDNRPCPSNVVHREVGPKDSYDVALAHSPSQFYGMRKNIEKSGVKLPLIYVCHVGLVDNLVKDGVEGRSYDQFLDDLEECPIVCVSYFMPAQFRFRSRKLLSVVPHYVPTEVVGEPVWIGGGKHVVNVVNGFYHANRGTGAEQWDRLTIPRRLYGDNNGDKGVGKLHTIEDFRDAMQTPAAFLWCANNVAMSFAPLEAMAIGVPLIAPRTADWPILITDRETGLLYEYGNIDQCESCYHELVNNPELAQKIGRAGARRVRGIFNKEAFRRGWIAAIAAAVSKT